MMKISIEFDAPEGAIEFLGLLKSRTQTKTEDATKVTAPAKPQTAPEERVKMSVRKNKMWTEGELKMVSELWGKESASSIAKRLGRTTVSVKSKVAKARKMQEEAQAQKEA